jgi:hypothetical protein
MKVVGRKKPPIIVKAIKNPVVGRKTPKKKR